jgi:Rap1a immunity proteins
MTAFVTQSVARAFAQLVNFTGGGRQVQAVVCAALIVSATEAIAQSPNGDLSADSIFRGCKALVEGQAPNAELFRLGNICAGMVVGFASVGQYLAPPEWQFCPPTTTNSQQLAQVVLNYREAHPQQTPEDLRKVILEAFHDAWPCKSTR